MDKEKSDKEKGPGGKNTARGYKTRKAFKGFLNAPIETGNGEMAVQD